MTSLVGTCIFCGAQKPCLWVRRPVDDSPDGPHGPTLQRVAICGDCLVGMQVVVDDGPPGLSGQEEAPRFP